MHTTATICFTEISYSSPVLQCPYCIHQILFFSFYSYSAMFVGYINVISKLTRSDRQYLSHNIMNYIVKLCFLLNIANPLVQYITLFFYWGML